MRSIASCVLALCLLSPQLHLCTAQLTAAQKQGTALNQRCVASQCLHTAVLTAHNSCRCTVSPAYVCCVALLCLFIACSQSAGNERVHMVSAYARVRMCKLIKRCRDTDLEQVAQQFASNLLRSVSLEHSQCVA